MQLLNLRVCEMAAAAMPPIPIKVSESSVLFCFVCFFFARSFLFLSFQLWRSTLAAGGIEHNEGIVRHFGRVDAQRRTAEGGGAALSPQPVQQLHSPAQQPFT